MSVHSLPLRTLACSLLLALALVACGTAAGTRTDALIDASGGSVAITDGTARGAGIDVPSGAVDEPTRFEVTSGDPADGLAAGLHAIGPMITFGPEGAVFATPVHITLPASREPMVLLTRPHGGGAWTRVDGAVWDSETGLVSADVMHFSDFVPVERDEIMVADGGVDDGGTPGTDASDFCTLNPRDPSCVTTEPPMPSCNALTQDCADGQMCVATDQESGYDWGDGRPAYCIPAGTLPLGSPCDAPSDCAIGTQCVFQTMYDPTESTIWYSQETDYLPMYESFCMAVCVHDTTTGCPDGELCHPVQLWGFSGRDVNEAVGVCAPPPPGSPPRT
jgi:hypothetical protein